MCLNYNMLKNQGVVEPVGRRAAVYCHYECAVAVFYLGG